jgi:EAL domain-containing protein (putative c-di-GMP-specific phosphodiesterase class I)
VARLDRDAEGRAIIYAIVSLATALGVRVTGEGIETASQLATWRPSASQGLKG